MAPRRFHAAAIALVVVCAGCSSSDHSALAVDFRSDLLPELELSEVIVAIDALGLQRTVPISESDPLISGTRLARFEDLSGGHIVEVRLFDAHGARIGSRRVLVQVDGETATTVVFTRSCLSVSCPGEHADRTECLNGTCVLPECTPETPSACGDDFCFTDDACPAPTAECARAECAEGACFDVPQDGLCSDEQFCRAETGCVRRPTPRADTCPPLPPLDGTETVLGPDQADELPAIISAASPGETFALEAGRYRLSTELRVEADGVTLRSVSDDALAVLDADYSARTVVAVFANDVTIAHLGLEHATDSAIRVEPQSASVTGLRVYDVRSRDHGTWHLYAVPFTSDTLFYVDDSEVACSEFTLSDEGRARIRRTERMCGTGGVRVTGGRTWSIRDNRFEGFYCDETLVPNPTIWTQRGARDVIIERNILLDCPRSISVGFFGDTQSRTYEDDPYPDVVGTITDFDGIVRSNIVFSNLSFHDTGIEVANAVGAQILHNTVVSGAAATRVLASIDVRGEVTQATLGNNLVRTISTRNGGRFDSAGLNARDTPLELFVDPAGGDLHLRGDATAAIDQGAELLGSGLDIDGQERDEQPDLGADEL